jgi:thiol-disulfide isomerase/thioredoxin
MNAAYLAGKFAAALPYDRYVMTGKDDQKRRWQQVYEAAHLSPDQTRLVSSFQRDMKVLIVSGIWCGDCVQQCPLIQKIAEVNRSHIDLRLLDRDEHRDLIEQLRINAGDRVPVVLFMAEDYELCSIEGDRTLNRYRTLAAKNMAAACPLPIAVPDRDELSATLQDWLNEFERIQLMLLLSTRLRMKHEA